MLKLITSLSAFLLGTLAPQQNPETPVKRLEVGSNIELVLTDEASGNDEIPTGILVEKTGNCLKLKSTSAERLKVKLHLASVAEIRTKDNTLITIFESTKSEEIRISLGAKSVLTGNLSAKKLILEAGKGSVVQARIDVDDFIAELQQDSRSNFGGMVQTINLKARDGAICKAENLATESASIITEGKAIVNANVKTFMYTDLGEGSRLTYAKNKCEGGLKVQNGSEVTPVVALTK